MHEDALPLLGQVDPINSQQTFFLEQHLMVEETEAFLSTQSVQPYIHLQDLCAPACP